MICVVLASTKMNPLHGSTHFTHDSGAFPIGPGRLQGRFPLA